MKIFSQIVVLLVCVCSSLWTLTANAQATAPKLGPPSEQPAPKNAARFVCTFDASLPAPRALTTALLKVAPDYCAAQELVAHIEDIHRLSTQEEVDAVFKQSETMFSDRRLAASISCTEAVSVAVTSWQHLHRPPKFLTVEQRFQLAFEDGVRFGPRLRDCQTDIRVFPRRTEAFRSRISQ
jgi:hypothetical protein